MAKLVFRFLWVEFQFQDLCEAESDHGIRRVLKNLPRSLSETYDRLLGRIEGAERREMIERMFKWVLCARQPLHVDELREGIAFTLDDEAWDGEKVVTDFRRLVRACGNLVVIDGETQIVQLAHYTVQQYLLQPRENRLRFTIQEANNMAGEVCVAYLNFSNFDTRMTRYKENMNTDMIALSKIASHGPLLSPDTPGRRAIQIWDSFRKSGLTTDIDIARHLPKREVKSQELSRFAFLPYIAAHWLWHTTDFDSGPISDETNSQSTSRRDRLFKDLILSKQMLFKIRPWAEFTKTYQRSSGIALLGWAFMTNHRYLIKMASVNNEPVDPKQLIWQAWLWFINDSSSVKTFFPDGRIAFEGPITQTMLDKLSSFSEDSYTVEQPESGWLYSKLLFACRNGHLDVIKMCDLKTFVASPGLLDHLILEATISGQLPIVDYLCAEIEYTDPNAFLFKTRLSNNQHIPLC